MPSNLLYIFVEGTNDERFFERIFTPFFYDKGIKVIFIKYASKKNSLVKKQIRKIESRSNQDYIFATDLDSHSFSCIGSCKTARIRDYSVDSQKIIVVKEEIESWYLAGIRNFSSALQNYGNTDKLTKEMFEEMIPDGFNVIDFMIEILKTYDLNKGSNNNSSLNYFIENFFRTFSITI